MKIRRLLGVSESKADLPTSSMSIGNAAGYGDSGAAAVGGRPRLRMNRARARAAAADEARQRGELWGPLHGLPMTVKEEMAVAGLARCCGRAADAGASRAGGRGAIELGVITQSAGAFRRELLERKKSKHSASWLCSPSCFCCRCDVVRSCRC